MIPELARRPAPSGLADRTANPVAGQRSTPFDSGRNHFGRIVAPACGAAEGSAVRGCVARDNTPVIFTRGGSALKACQYCGPSISHSGVCPRVKAIEYHENGQLKRVEFREEPPAGTAPVRGNRPPRPSPPVVLPLLPVPIPPAVTLPWRPNDIYCTTHPDTVVPTRTA